MIGLVYEIDSKKIIAQIENVQSYMDTEIIGLNSFVRGIDKSKADFIIVESTNLQIGDTIDLSKINDVRHLIPETPEQKIERMQAEFDQAIMELTMAIAMK